jgi:hypothetical protein
VGGGPLLRHNGNGGSRIDHHVALGWGWLSLLPLAGSSSRRLDYHLNVGLLDRLGGGSHGLGG